ncbi:MAG: peptidylprolyl isomerase [Chloroflexi bacterium]|nr:peptidylprolyl isomerase [Chloroflexota bacterium]
MSPKERAPEVRPTRRQAHRWQKEQRRQRIAIVAGIAALLIIVSIPLYGFVATFILPPKKVIARVNDTTFTTGYLVRLLRMQQKGAEATGQNLDLGSMPFQLVNVLTENELIRQASPRYNISVSDEEIQAEVRIRIMGKPKEGDSTPPEQLDRDFKERYRQYLNQIQLPEQEHRRIVRWDLSREKLRELLGQEVPTVLPHIRLYSMTLPDQQKVDEVQRKLKQGFTFQQLAKDFSTLPSAQQGGDQGWMPKGILDTQLEEKLFKLKKGELTEPIAKPEAGFDLYYVEDVAEARPVEDKHRESLKTNALQEWVNQERSKNRVEFSFDSDTYAWVVKQLKISESRRAQPPQS